jgi:hypothetical protein
MQQTPEQDDSNAQRQTDEPLVARPHPHDDEPRARSQAALVRESLVRCPGIGEPAIQ